jgi:HAD superfamily hydrolase (TIGR01490 family)
VRAIAFFDVDKTVLAVNSATLWVRREVRTGRLTRAMAARAAGWTLLYELGFARMEKVIEEAVETLAGQPEADLVARVEAFFREEIADQIRPGARRAIERHRERGDAVALLTSSSNYLGAQVADAVGAHHVLSNAFETDAGGCFTGAPRRPLCFGPGKLEHALQLVEALDAPLAECTFYTDSFSDLPVLERVGHPVAVHPDPRLRRLAQRRGWPIELWS